MVDTTGSLALVPSPLYRKVRDALADTIRNGEWIVGDALPNEANLAHRFGVSIGTIRRAIAGLEDDGLLKRIQGRGTFVAGFGSHVLKQKFNRLCSNGTGPVQHCYRLVSTTVTCCVPEGAHLALRLPNTAKLLEICQEVIIESACVGIETSYLEVDRFPGFERLISYGQHLYPTLADCGCIIVHATDIISAKLRTSEDKVGADVVVGAPLLAVERTAFAMNKVPIEYRLCIYDAAKVSYSSCLT